MRLGLRLTQRVVMTPLLQQAIQLLQLSTLELKEVVEQELRDNPMLEEVPTEGTDASAEPPSEDLADAPPGPTTNEPAPKEASSVAEERTDDLPFDLTSAVFDQSDERTPVSTEERDELPFENLGRGDISLAEHLAEDGR